MSDNSFRGYFSECKGIKKIIKRYIDEPCDPVSVIHRPGRHIPDYQSRIRISKVWRIDKLESKDATFGKITDFTPSTIRNLIRSGEIDDRISINRRGRRDNERS